MDHGAIPSKIRAGWLEDRVSIDFRDASTRKDTAEGNSMNLLSNSNRREFLRGAALTGAGLALSNRLLAAREKTVLVFTKSSGWEHDVVKRIDGKPSIADDAVTELGIGTATRLG